MNDKSTEDAIDVPPPRSTSDEQGIGSPPTSTAVGADQPADTDRLADALEFATRYIARASRTLDDNKRLTLEFAARLARTTDGAESPSTTAGEGDRAGEGQQAPQSANDKIDRDLDNIDWLHTECKWLEDRVNYPIAREAITLARRLFDIASEGLFTGHDSRMQLGALGGDCRRVIRSVSESLDIAVNRKNEKARVAWVVLALDEAKANLDSGLSLDEVAERTATLAQSRTGHPIASGIDEWKRALRLPNGRENWRGPFVQGRGNPGPHASYKPHVIVYRLLEPGETDERQIGRKASQLLGNYREAFKKSEEVSDQTKVDHEDVDKNRE